MNEQQKIAQLFREFCAALTGRDTDALRRILDPDCTVIPLTGLKQSGETFISSVDSGADRYEHSRLKNIDLRVIGNAAWMIGRSEMTAALYGGELRVWPLAFKITLRSSAGGWRFTEIRFSTFE
ncbi:MAG: nuclear transport factor 2 family protein [Ruminococcus sp.]|nr:nuclear transport factor 2 family protein [Ruminococcus sp.]